MKTVKTSQIMDAVKELCMSANYDLGEDMMAAFDRALAEENSPTGKTVLGILKENADIAESEKVPLCQDTGFSVFFVEVGQNVRIEGGNLEDALNEGVRRGYAEGYLRKSIVNDPFLRVNTKDNTPAVIHTRLVPGDALKIVMMAKGGGCENMSRLAMLKPAQGWEGVRNFIVDTAKQAGPNACPPIIVGVGIGGTFEKAAYLAKHSLLRPVGSENPDPELRNKEAELYELINQLGIGPQGYGGKTTSLAIHIESYPCHIASLPVAVNIECHAHRHKEIVF